MLVIKYKGIYMRKRLFSTIFLLGCLLLLWEEAGRQQNKQVYESISEELTDSPALSDCLFTKSGALFNSIFTEIDFMSNDIEYRMLESMVSGNDASVSNESVSEGDLPDHNEYDNLAIADVSDYVNVRKEPNTESEILGKIYDGAVAQILLCTGDQNEWFYVLSGSVKGYIKAEYFMYGDTAQAVIDDYVNQYAYVDADRLNVRKEPTTDARRMGYIDYGEKVKIIEDCGDWLKVRYTGDTEGYIAAEFVTVSEEFTYAISIEEENAQRALLDEFREREQITEQEVPENTLTFVLPTTTYTSNEELRQAIVDYAKQFLGNVYVHGGQSLSDGTDCSGFTCYIYADFGYSISRTPSGQYKGAGRSIDMSEIQPGDIICYSSNGKSCTHVGLYVGDGQIIHEANSRKGVIISEADYSTIIGIRNVID